MSFRNLFLLLTVSLLMSACQSETKQPNTVSEIEIPALLERSEKIRYEKEWEAVQNTYARQTQKINSGQDRAKGLLTMAQLFTMEARVTGEHGHYYPGALQLLEELEDTKDLSDDLLFMSLSTKAGVLLSQHDFDQALSTGLKAVKLNPYNAQIYGVLVDASVELGQYEQAVSYADQMVAIRPDLRSYSRVSYLREIYGQPEAAIEAMEMAADAGAPGSEEAAWTRLQLGELHARYGAPEKAKMEFKRILVERPDYPFAIAALAELQLQNGQMQEAEKQFAKAGNIIPEFSFYQSLAVIYQHTDRTELAQKTAEEVLAMLEDDIQHGHNMNLEMADLYSDIFNQPETALEYALDEYQKRPENITVNQVLAELYHQTGEDQKAKEHIRKAMITESTDPELLALSQSLNK